MRVLIFHGYLLRGTGSGIYNASVAAALARLGHEVHLLSQEHDPPEFPPGPGSVVLHRPGIGGLLPVFVHDRYAGFEVKTFGELTDAELTTYIDANVTAVRDLLDELGGVDAALAGHLVMGPVILARAGLRYALKVHGSDLSYTVLPDRGRFVPYAEEAVASANGILVGSGHIAARLREAVDRPEVNAKVRLGPPGVDTELFSPIEPPSRPDRLRELAARLRLGREEKGSVATADLNDGDEVAAPADAARAGGAEEGPRPSTLRERRTGSRFRDRTRAPSAWDRDVHHAADAIDWFADGEGPRVVFVGKLIVSKGVDLLLAAWPLVHRAHPTARLLIVGFGAYEATLGRLWAALAAGDLDTARAIAARGRAEEGGVEAPLRMLEAFLADPPAEYVGAAADAAASVAFAGRLEHDEVGALVPAGDALVFPSTWPEAFGMVAAEAAAAGVLPVSAAHSGALEVSSQLAAELPMPARELVSFTLGDQAVPAIAARLDRWLAMTPDDRATVRAVLRATVERLWSWEGVARGVLAAAAGSLEELPRPAAE